MTISLLACLLVIFGSITSLLGVCLKNRTHSWSMFLAGFSVATFFISGLLLFATYFGLLTIPVP